MWKASTLIERSSPWREIQATLEAQHNALTTLIADIGAGRVHAPMTDSERFDLVLGITCHAVYHAGQVQLIKAIKTQNV